jgi:hypothetical protein
MYVWCVAAIAGRKADLEQQKEGKGHIVCKGKRKGEKE